MIFACFLMENLNFELGGLAHASQLSQPAPPHASKWCPTCPGGGAKALEVPNHEKNVFFDDFCSFLGGKTEF